MSAQGQRKASRRRRSAWWESLWLSGLLQVVLALYLCLALTGPVGSWWEALHGAGTSDLLAVGNRGGPVGALLNLACRVLCGSAWCWFVPLLLLGEGIGRLLQRGGFAWAIGRRAIPLWLTSTAWVAQPEGILSPATAAAWGGVGGVWLGRGFHTLFGLWGGRIFLSFLLLTSLVLLLRPWLGPLMRRLVPVGRSVFVFVGRAMLAMVRVLLVVLRGVVVWPVRQLRGLGTQAEQASHTHAPRATSPRDQVYSTTENKPRRRVHGIDASTVSAKATGGEDVVSAAPGVGTQENMDAAEVLASSAMAEVAPQDIQSPPARIAKPVRRDRPIVLPGIELLREPDPDFRPPTPANLDASADLLESTLRSFGVEGEVKDVRPGPVVTTFEYQPASGTKVSQIVQRSDDLALAMKARTIRMEAPIPGKAAVGIEIPNPFTQIVRLKELLQGARNIPRTPLSVVLGKDVVGNPVVIDIATLPHLLVAGSTGSGKSVCLNSLICNLLLYNGPERVRLVLIDPKMLEMSVYNGIPHLLMPVVTDPKEALRALKWMVAQMELRYRLLARAGVRDIAAYNVKVKRGEVEGLDGEPVSDYMPFYLTIVDELADLMVRLGQEIEMPITRLAQKARAVGVHLILATQRPSVDVLTGVIKANVPCRVAFRVIQKNDSRTILDLNGAEKLLGNGDMLYLQPGRALPVRLHGSFIDVEECEAIVEHWRQYADLTEDISLDESPSGGTLHTGEDDLFEDARRIVVLHQSGSTSLLQRRLRIGYTRAGRLIDMLEEAGVVGPFTGSKAREVLLKPQELPDWEGPEAGGAEA